MDPGTEEPDSPRQTCLPIMLTGMIGSIFLMLLIVATGGWVLYVVLMVGGLGLYVLFHYALWGGLMSQKADREREAEELRREDEPDWPLPDAERFGKF